MWKRSGKATVSAKKWQAIIMQIKCASAQVGELGQWREVWRKPGWWSLLRQKTVKMWMQRTTVRVTQEKAYFLWSVLPWVTSVNDIHRQAYKLSESTGLDFQIICFGKTFSTLKWTQKCTWLNKCYCLNIHITNSPQLWKSHFSSM